MKPEIKFYNINGENVPAATATLGVTDLAILRGHGVFDYFQVRRGIPLFIDYYVNRFENSANAIALPLPISKEELKQRIQNLIDLNTLKEGAIRLVLTGGYPTDGYTPIEPNLLILQHHLPSYPETHYTEGVKIITHDYTRDTPEAKTINYVEGIKLISRLKEAGALEPLYHDGTHITETTRSNCFIVTPEGKVVTPGEGSLKGITRRNVVDLAKANYDFEERPVTLSEVLNAKEVFLTSSTKGVMPVSQVDGTLIGNRKVGDISKHLSQLLTELTNKYLDNRVNKGK